MDKDIAKLILRWRNDPVAFVREALSAEPDTWQEESLNALVTNDRISIRSGHGVGKSAFLSWVLLWFLCTRYPAKVAATAPSAHQLHDILWSEVHMWVRRMKPELAEQFYIKADKIELVGGALECFAVARTARKEAPDALQGMHSENMLFLMDEASGIDEVIFEVAAGALSTPGAKQILTGNPIRATGYFYRSQMPGSGFWTRKVASTEAKQVSKQFIQDMITAYGEDSNVYKVRVLGEFPTSDDDTLISFELIEGATKRDVNIQRRDAIWGLDPARYGNDTSCLVKRFPRGVVDMPKVWSKLSTMELVGQLKNEYDNTVDDEKPIVIYVDSIGIGAGVVDRALELDLPVVGINVSESPAILAGTAFRMRDELWLLAAGWFESREVKVCNHARLINELSSIRKGFTSSGKTRIESKDDMKKRTQRSPDVGDAFVLTFAYSSGTSFVANDNTSYRNWKKPIRRKLQGAYV